MNSLAPISARMCTVPFIPLLQKADPSLFEDQLTCWSIAWWVNKAISGEKNRQDNFYEIAKRITTPFPANEESHDLTFQKAINHLFGILMEAFFKIDEFSELEKAKKLPKKSKLFMEKILKESNYPFNLVENYHCIPIA